MQKNIIKSNCSAAIKCKYIFRKALDIHGNICYTENTDLNERLVNVMTNMNFINLNVRMGNIIHSRFRL